MTLWFILRNFCLALVNDPMGQLASPSAPLGNPGTVGFGFGLFLGTEIIGYSGNGYLQEMVPWLGGENFMMINDDS